MAVTAPAVPDNRVVDPGSQAADLADSRAVVPAGSRVAVLAGIRGAAGNPAVGRVVAGTRPVVGIRVVVGTRAMAGSGVGNRPAGAAASNRSGHRGWRSRMGPRRRVIRPEENLREGAGTLRTSWSRTNGPDVHGLRGRRSARQQANGIPDAGASVADTLTGRRSPAVTESGGGGRAGPARVSRRQTAAAHRAPDRRAQLSSVREPQPRPAGNCTVRGPGRAVRHGVPSPPRAPQPTVHEVSTATGSGIVSSSSGTPAAARAAAK